MGRRRSKWRRGKQTSRGRFSKRISSKKTTIKPGEMIYYKDDFYEMIKGYGDKFSEQKYTLLTPGEKGNEFRSAIKRIANK